MKAAWHILNKVMVKQFYLQNAGLFLFAFLFLFGIVDAGHIVYYHKSLMLSIISLPLFLFVVMMVWMLYNIKCITFCSNAVQAADGSFLYQLRALPTALQWLLYACAGTVLYLPVLLYACVLAIFAFKINGVVTWQVMAWQILMIVMSATSLFITVNKTSESLITGLAASVRKMFTVKIGYHFFLLAYIFNEKKAAFAIVKIFSLLMLGMLLVRNEDSFDAGLFAIFFPLAITAHASLVMYCVDFNETILHTNRNLPLHWLQVAAMYLFTWFIILLPETAFMFINNHGNLPLLQISMEAVTAIVVLFLYSGMSLGCGLDKERYLLFVFMSYIVVLILQKTIGHVAAAVAMAALSLMVFKAHYYSFEREQAK
jgi:hypothetical protein